jgi:hypothetical protein
MDLIAAGRTLLLRETPHAKPHLWLVLTNPDGNPEEIVAVMVRTHRAYTDATVVLEPGDHPFIHHRSSATTQRLAGSAWTASWPGCGSGNAT